MIPLIKIFFIFCFLYFIENGTSQMANCDKACTPFSGCFSAQQIMKHNGTRPTICYFIGYEPYVCCPLNIPELEDDRPPLRISEKKCEQYYPTPPPFVAIGGYETEPDEFPFMAVIGYGNTSNPIYNCGGILVEKNFVITAAHCAYYNGEPAAVVKIGGNPLSDNATQPIKVVKVIVHPKYQSSTELNDIAVLALAKHVDEKPVCLNEPQGLYLELEYYSQVIAMGYGSTSFGGAFSKKLLKVYLNVIENDVCKKDYQNQPIVESQLCVQGNERQLNNTETVIQDTCQGDSGGPLLLQSSLTYKPRVVGIVSYGQGCGTKIPGIYTNISSYIDWIESIVWPQNNEEPIFIVA